MPRRDDGTQVPNPIRCDRGHIHPSRTAAVKCNRKNRAKEAHR